MTPPKSRGTNIVELAFFAISCLQVLQINNYMNTEELIHEGYLAWDEENSSYEFSDEELFAAGAKFIINYLIQHGKL